MKPYASINYKQLSADFLGFNPTYVCLDQRVQNICIFLVSMKIHVKYNVLNRIYDGIRPRQLNLRLVFKLFSLMRGLQDSQWAFGAKMTSCRRRCEVITSHRR